MSTNKTNPENWLNEHGDYLYRYALVRVSDQMIAEDLVQDTFLSAFKSYEKFKGASSLRTWFVTILKNKIIDYYRKSNRKDVSYEQVSPQDDSNDFEDNGFWKLANAPKDWGENPETALEQTEFIQILNSCLSLLPGKTANVFTMRQIDGYESEEICKNLEISSSNLWVLLHRARNQLRKCLEINWFGKNE